MTKKELKGIILEVVKESMAQHPHTKINDKLMQIINRHKESDQEEPYKGDPNKGNAILDKANPENVAKILKGEKPIYEGELEDYKVEYWYRQGDDKDFDTITVKAASKEEAIEKAKKEAGRYAIQSSFKIV